jgi:hypothetical protein
VRAPLFKATPQAGMGCAFGALALPSGSRMRSPSFPGSIVAEMVAGDEKVIEHHEDYALLREAMSMEKRYFTSALKSRS